MGESVWFWQRIVSPHMAGLAAALASTGRAVTYVAEQAMSTHRGAQGWVAPDLGDAQLQFAPTRQAARAIVGAAPTDSVHICQGLRANGVVGAAQIELAKRRIRQWVIMETVDDVGWLGGVKRLEYRRLIWKWRSSVSGILATGDDTSAWLRKRGMPTESLFPFAYFLPEVAGSPRDGSLPGASTRFLFVGRLIDLKRLDLLIDALARLGDASFDLTVVGSGPQEASLRSLAGARLPGRVRWLGTRPIAEIPGLMAQADCLVFPSRYDGWGAVVSEALMAGTPVICSDAVGAAGVVRASGSGGVFPTNDIEGLVTLLRRALLKGRQPNEERGTLATWGRRLGAQSGAHYLNAILVHAAGKAARPVAPWLEQRRSAAL